MSEKLQESKQWYTLQVQSGTERSVKQNVEERAIKQDMSHFFEDIVIPATKVKEIKRGKSVISDKKFMPGYMLIKMVMTDKSWHLVTDIPKVKGFLGSNKNRPESLNQKDVDRILSKMDSDSESALLSSIYKIGGNVKIIDGPFDNFSGVIEEVDEENEKLKVSVKIFGKITPIELSFVQVAQVKGDSE